MNTGKSDSQPARHSERLQNEHGLLNTTMQGTCHNLLLLLHTALNICLSPAPLLQSRLGNTRLQPQTHRLLRTHHGLSAG